MKTLVVTGGIGSGKSAVCRRLALKGVPVYDSDSRTRGLYDRYPDLALRISDALGCRITDAQGRVDRRLLASVVFSDSGKLAVLESVVHPAVKADFEGWRDVSLAEGAPFVVMESAIILEKPLFRDIADLVLLVDAPVGLRLERACARDGASEAEIRSRMARQRLLNDISEGRVKAEADFVIVNDSDEESLYRQVDKVYDSVCCKFQK